LVGIIEQTQQKHQGGQEMSIQSDPIDVWISYFKFLIGMGFMVTLILLWLAFLINSLPPDPMDQLQRQAQYERNKGEGR
jgi:cytochrome bd-type quinol oxidase subunit 1